MSPKNPQASTSMMSSGAPSPMDAKALRDLEVKKTCHYFDLTATKGSLAVIRECYSISEEYALYVLLPRQEMTKLWLELNEVRGDLFEAQKQLKELPAKGCKVDDNLLKAVRELDTQQVELPKQAIKDYKWTTEFKLGL
ncbi:hypothetical protein GW17_00046226 [Ensete ventricosum]|nr:hypothetical protein GW17_00046226 [Ensete ventricosum]